MQQETDRQSRIRPRHIAILKILLALGGGLSSTAFAQVVSQPAFRPFSPSLQKAKERAPGAEMNGRNVPELSLSSFTPEEIAQLSKPPYSTRVGASRSTTALELAGAWEVNPQGRRFWSVRISVPRAAGLRVHFTQFSIGAGKVWVGGQEASAARWFGPYTDRGLLGDGDFWSETIFADSIEIEFLPESNTGQVPFHIGELFQWWRSLGSFAFGSGSPAVLGLNAADVPTTCFRDVSCNNANPLVEQASEATAYVTVPTGQCSGTLIHDSIGSKTLYFLTAGHCITSQSDATASEFYFGFRTSSCADPQGGFVDPSLDPGPHHVSGATYLTSSYRALGPEMADTSVPDFALVILSGPPPDYQGQLASTNTDGQPQDAVFTVSHPQNLPQAFASGNIGSLDGSANDFFLVDLTVGASNHGSSGSGLYDQSGNLIGVDSFGAMNASSCSDVHTSGYTRYSSIYPQIQGYLNGSGTPGAPVISAFYANTTTISQGQSATLTWTVQNASNVTIQPDVGAVDPQVGSVSVSPTLSTTYTLTAGNFFGSSTQTVTVNVQSSGGGGGSNPVNGILPHIAVGGSFVTDFYVVNTGSGVGNFSISFRGDDGGPIIIPVKDRGSIPTLSDSVPPGGARFYEAGTPSGSPLTGSGIITADPGITIQAVFRRHGSDHSYYEAAVPASAGNMEIVVPFDDTTFAPNGDQIYTGLAIANLDIDASANVICTARDTSGFRIPDAVTVPQLNPLGHWASVLFPALLGLRGTIDCQSVTKIGAIGIRALGTNAISSLPEIVPATGPSTIRLLPHLGFGGSFVMDFYVMNTNDAPREFGIDFRDDNGNPVSIPIAGQGAQGGIAGTVPAHGVNYYEAGRADDPPVSGAALIEAAPDIVVQAVLRRHGSDHSYYEAAVPVSNGSFEIAVPFDATKFAENGDQIYTGLAIANLDSSEPAGVNCSARDTQGNNIPGAITVPALDPAGHWASASFPALIGKRGTLDCTSDRGQIGAIGIRALGTNAISSLPVIPLTVAKRPAQITNPTPGSTLVMPSVTFSWGPSHPGASGYFLDVGTTAGGNDISSQGAFPPEVTSSSSVMVPLNGNPIYVTLSTLFSDGMLVTSTTTYATQSIVDAVLGTYTVTPGGNPVSTSETYCRSKGKGSVTPTVTSIPQAQLNISRDDAGVLHFIVSSAGAVLPALHYILPPVDHTADSIVFQPTLFQQIEADGLHGYDSTPTASPGFAVNRTFSSDGTSGTVRAQGLGPGTPDILGSTLTFEGFYAATPTSCDSYTDVVISFDFIKTLQ